MATKLTDHELSQIKAATGRKLELNYAIFIRQLLEHIAALTGKGKETDIEDKVASA